MNSERILARAVLCLLLTLPAFAPAAAESAAGLVADGNRAYRAGRMEDALSAYEQASVKEPEAAQIYFNRGAALYRKGDFAAASNMFNKAALKSKDLKLEAKANYNAGNCLFSEVERQKDGDLKKALAACESSILRYQEAIHLDPQLKEAAENIEIARLRMKVILDELKKKAEEAEKQQKQGDDLAERLKQLGEKQDKALQKNKDLAKDKTERDDSPDLQRQTQDLADEQKTLQQDTKTLAEEMKNLQDSPGQSPEDQQRKDALDKAGQHLKQAQDKQGAAADDLRQNGLEAAQPDQADAAKELKEAMNSLAGSKQEQQQGNQKQEGQNDRQDQEQQQEQQTSQENADQQDTETAQLNEQAQSILDEEKNREEADRRSLAPYRTVDKDW